MTATTLPRNRAAAAARTVRLTAALLNIYIYLLLLLSPELTMTEMFYLATTACNTGTDRTGVS